MEMEWLGNRADVGLSQLIEVIDGAMQRNPRYWRTYYHGDAAQIALARKYSRSDRIRYYWSDPEVTEALDRLLANLEAHPVPLTLLSQFMPVQYQHASAGLLENRPLELILDQVMEVLQDYAAACGRDTIGM
jgi:D-tagatose-1,6-bisphosphate aldolase subunit GatZ/KbaZ